MKTRRIARTLAMLAVSAGLLLAVGTPVSFAKGSGGDAEPWLNLYGFVQLDMGYDAGQMHPDWYDVLRTTKMPADEDEFGEDGKFRASVRQSRLGVRASAATKLGDLKTLLEIDLDGSGTGWGGNLGSNLKFRDGKDVARLQVVVGEGIESYRNDAPADVALAMNPGNPVRPVEGELLPLTGIVLFLDHARNERWTSSLGYSSIEVDNTDGQAPSAFHRGDDALVNLLCTPVKDLMVGGEVQYGRRENFDDGWEVDDLRFPFTVKANFSTMIGGKERP